MPHLFARPPLAGLLVLTRALALCVALLPFAPLGCDDTTTAQPDTGRDTASHDSSAVIDVILSDADTDGADAGCTAIDERCLGSDKRAACVNGELVLENCGANEVCFLAKCAPIVCEAGSVTSCLDNGQYEGCSPQGTGNGVFNCAAGLTCVDGACIARVCEEGEKRCMDNDQVLVCNANGTAFTPSTRCSDTDIKRQCDEGECKPICEIAVKAASYVGCEYWAVDLDNAIDGPYDAAGQRYAVVVSNATSELDAVVQVHDATSWVTGTPLMEVTVAPGTLHTLVLPPGCYDNGSCPQAYAVNNTTLVPAAYRISSDVPITAYQFNPLDNANVFSNDASLLLPKTSIGYRYLVMTRMQQHDTLRGFLTVVGTEPVPTNVEVTVTANTIEGIDGQGNPIAAMNAGQSRVFVLNQFDVLNLTTRSVGDDLTGSEIVADRRVVVFGGSEASNAPETESITCCADHLEQQLYPVNNWGLRYHAAKSFARRGERDLWRVMARFDGTTVTTIPDQTGGPKVLNAGTWFEIITTNDFEVQGDKPILVGQFLASEWDPIDPDRGVPSNEAAGTGDPSFILGVPVEQYRSDYVFLSPDKYAYDYITVIAPTDASVVLDDVPLAADLFTPIGAGGFHVARLPVADGVHKVTASAPVGLFAYGYDEYVSYGYPAGLNLDELFQ